MGHRGSHPTREREPGKRKERGRKERHPRRNEIFIPRSDREVGPEENMVMVCARIVICVGGIETDWCRWEVCNGMKYVQER